MSYADAVSSADAQVEFRLILKWTEFHGIWKPFGRLDASGAAQLYNYSSDQYHPISTIDPTVSH